MRTRTFEPEIEALFSPGQGIPPGTISQDLSPGISSGISPKEELLSFFILDAKYSAWAASVDKLLELRKIVDILYFHGMMENLLIYLLCTPTYTYSYSYS